MNFFQITDLELQELLTELRNKPVKQYNLNTNEEPIEQKITFIANSLKPNPFISTYERVRYNKIKDRIVGIIPDLHEPFTVESALDFVHDTFNDHKVTDVVFIGDITDNHGISYHEKDASAKGIIYEHYDAAPRLAQWYKLYPDAKVCIGNHDELPFRKLKTAGLPSSWMKSYQQILNTPKGWDWAFSHIIDDVLYNHGTGKSGAMAAINFAKESRCSVMMGHLHTEMSIRYAASFKDLIFGGNVGCLIDRKAMAFAYARENSRKEVLGCSIVAENGKFPFNVPMRL